MLYPGLFLIMDSTERLNTMAFRCARGTNKSVRLQSIGHDLADHRGAIRTIREIHKEYTRFTKRHQQLVLAAAP
jgi:hypothetical protein